MATVIKKVSNQWDVNGVLVDAGNYKEFLTDENDLINFENFLLKLKNGRRIYRSVYPDKVKI